MSPLQTIRQLRNLTQEELQEISGISVRTIQRIESGTNPKGYTLKALAKALNIQETDLLEMEPQQYTGGPAWAKQINLSMLLLMFLPPLNVVVPLLVMYAKRQYDPVTKKLVNLQLLWSIGVLLMVIAVMILNDIFSIRGNYMKLAPVCWLIVNAFIILRNAVSLNKNHTLKISLGFDIL